MHNLLKENFRHTFEEAWRLTVEIAPIAKNDFLRSFLDPYYFTLLWKYNFQSKVNFIWRGLYFSFSCDSIRHIVSFFRKKE